MSSPWSRLTSSSLPRLTWPAAREIHPGGGGPSPATARLRLARKTPPRIDLSYGRADVSSFPGP